MTKTALITGCSSGIGLETAILLAREGHRVVATMRDVNKAGELRSRAEKYGVDIAVKALDVCDHNSVHTCVTETLASHERIDVLINNAGAGYLGTLEHTSFSELRQVMEVNFFGVWRMTEAVLPFMREAGSGRIISVTSIGGLIGQPFNDAYCAAKFAVEGMMESLAPAVSQHGVHISLIEPGPVKTEFVANLSDSLTRRQAATDDPYKPLLDAYLGASTGVIERIGQTGQQVAAVILQAATDPSPHLRYPTSAAMHELIARKYVDPTGDSVRAIADGRLEADQS